MHLKKIRLGPYETGMLACVAGATLLRMLLVFYNWPTTNSDEATMGLMGLHIAYRGEHPTFFYGQYYMGPMEAYIAAALFHIMDPSTFTFRLGLIPLFALFLVCMYFLTSLLYTKRLALATVALLSLGSGDIILHQLRGIGGYPEIVLLGALILLITARLSLSAQRGDEDGAGQSRLPHVLAYGLLGLVVGFALWTDSLILPIVATTALTLFLFCRRALRGWSGLSLLLGLVAGALPLIIYNLTAPPGHTSINALLDVQHGGADKLAAMHLPLVRQLIGSLLVAQPAITGLNPLCDPSVFPLFGPGTAQTVPCAVLQGGWSLGYFVLWGSAVVLAARALFPVVGARLIRSGSDQPDRINPGAINLAPTDMGEQAFEQRRAAILQWNRLMLLLVAGLTLLSYTISPAAALYPGPTSRYLICMQIATPAVLWPLWNGFSLPALRLAERTAVCAKGLLVLRVGVLLLIAATFLMGTVRTLQDIPAAQADYNRYETLIGVLSRIGATRIYSDYWTCNRIIFQSNERIICAVLNDQLGPGQDRYPPYPTTVRADPHAAYAFAIDPSVGTPAATGIAQAKTFEQRVLAQKKVLYQRYVFQGYVIYQPIQTGGSS